jgi:hypothetical protein
MVVIESHFAERQDRPVGLQLAKARQVDDVDLVAVIGVYADCATHVRPPAAQRDRPLGVGWIRPDRDDSLNTRRGRACQYIAQLRLQPRVGQVTV